MSAEVVGSIGLEVGGVVRCRPSLDLHASLRQGQFSTSTDRLTCSIVLKVGMVGDAQIGKTSLMVKYVEGSFE